jgi:polysaccharide pyruvyl transferase WcaK-like protein
LGGAKVVFLSVGVGPIEHPVSRFLMLRALHLADSRSYRETAALDYLRKLGFDTSADRIYPDLVLSLDPEVLSPTPAHTGWRREVGLGLINYRGWRHNPVAGEPVFRAYIGKMQGFLRWLLRNNYTVRLLTGDKTDQASVEEMLAFAATEPLREYRHRLILEPVADIRGLFHQIAQTDLVVASRFHNVLCSLMMKKPVVSIGYHAKNDLLMEAFGLGAYCQRIDTLDTDLLIRQFQDCGDRRDALTRGIQARLDDFRERLDEQYLQLLFPVRRNA